MPSATPGRSFRLSTLPLLLLSSAALAQPADSETSQATNVAADTFAIPDDLQNIEQLMAFVEEIDSLEPAGGGEQELVAHQRKVARTVVAAAEQLSAQKLSDEDAMKSVYLRLQGLRILSQLSEPKADELLEKAIHSAVSDARSDVQAVGLKFLVQTGFAQWTLWGDEEKTEFIDRIVTVVTQREPERNHVDLVISVVNSLDGHGDQYARQLMAKLVPHFQSSQQPEIHRALTLLKGIERRVNLPGNKIELSGALLDGSELDWDSYRGKVVLVDFSATWCPPCRAEIPNVLKMYEAYHDKGFEVIGISLDRTREEAESYIEQENIPWPTMFSKDPAETYWRHPMAVHYGVSGIPFAILVDREGKVVHMLARGKNLMRELRRLLGEPVARAQQRTDASVQRVSDPASGN